MGHESVSSNDELFEQTEGPIVSPPSQLPLGLSARPTDSLNKDVHVFTEGLFRSCFSDLTAALA